MKYLSSQSQNEFINILAEDVKNRIVNDVNASGMYSVMADTSPDTSNADRLVAARHADEENCPQERVLEMKETSDKTGEGQAKDIIKSLESRNLSKENLVFQTYDYTASMSGEYRGAQRCLQDILGRSVPYIPCQGHRSNTFIEDASKVKLVSSMYELLQELYVFFSKSCKRESVLCKQLETVDDALKLQNLSKTRWVYQSESIKAVWNSFDAVEEALKLVSVQEKIDKATRNKADSLRNKMLKFNFIFSLMFMRLIMNKTKIMTMELQKESLNILDALMLTDNPFPQENKRKTVLKSLDMEKMNEISSLFPPSITVNAECLHAESEIFRSRVEKSNEPCKTVEDACQQAYFNKSIFPNVYKAFKLLFTAPVNVAKDERIFSRMKIVKNFLRSTMSDTRLDDLIVLASEKHLVDSIDLNAAVKEWASQKNRKLKMN